MNTRLLDIGHTVMHACLAGVVLLPWLLFEAAAAPSGAGYRETVIAQVPVGETYHGWTAYFPAPQGPADNSVFIFNRTVAYTNRA